MVSLIYQVIFENINEADNKIAEEGEVETIALEKFDRASKLRIFHKFPNVVYYHKKKHLEY